MEVLMLLWLPTLVVTMLLVLLVDVTGTLPVLSPRLLLVGVIAPTLLLPLFVVVTTTDFSMPTEALPPAISKKK